MRAGKAVEYDRFGGVEELHFVEQARPAPGPDEVVIEVVAAALNHMDEYVRRGDFADEVTVAFPARQGSCFAGIVRAKGAGVKRLAVGQSVLGHDPHHAAHASYVTVPVGAVVPKPESVPWEVAGALYLAGTTAYTIVQSLRLGPEDTVVVSAAAGGVGHIEAQLARLAGALVIGIAGEDNQDYLRSIGAKAVLHGQGLEQRIRDAAQGRPLTAFIDNYAGYEDLAETLGVPQQRFVPSAKRREVELRFYNAPGDDPEVRIVLGDLVELIATWGLRVLISGFYAFDQLPDAIAELDQRHSRGKVLVGMHTSAPASSYLGQRTRFFKPAA